MIADQSGQEPLFAGREARQVGVPEQVGSMAMMLCVGDLKTDLVSPGRPGDELPGQLPLESPCLRHLAQKIQDHCFDSGSL